MTAPPITGALKHLMCRLRGHRFVAFCDGLKRRCDRCSREEWVVGNPYPRIGEPAYFWRHMDWDRTIRRRTTNHRGRSDG